jgi:poly(A) polymerase Pap1
VALQKLKGGEEGMIDTSNHFRVYAFGSYGLEVHSPRSDMDLLVVFSNFTERGALVEELLNGLKSSGLVAEAEVR